MTQAVGRLPYARRKLLRDPVFGYIHLEDYEERIIRTSLFRRLSRISQVHAAFPFYPGVTHTRYEHSIGVAYVAGEFTKFLLEDAVKNGELNEGERERLVKLARIWGLIHDIGHGPFSHAFEDHILRFKPAKICGKEAKDHNSLGLLLAKNDREFKEALNIAQASIDADFDTILDVFRIYQPLNCKSKPGTYEHQILENVFWFGYGADFIDYLQRDSLYAGTPEYGTLDWRRLVLTSHLIKKNKDLHFCIEDRSKYTLYSFIHSYLQMYLAVYFNKNARIMDNLIGRFLKSVNETGFFDFFLNLEKEDDIERFWIFDEHLLLGLFSLPYEEFKYFHVNIEESKFKKARELCLRILNVDLKCDDVIEKSYEKVPEYLGTAFYDMDVGSINGIRKLNKIVKAVFNYLRKIFFEETRLIEDWQDSWIEECFIDTPRLEKKRCPLYRLSLYNFLDKYGNLLRSEETGYPLSSELPKYVNTIRLYLHEELIKQLNELETDVTIYVKEHKLLFVKKNKDYSAEIVIDLHPDLYNRLLSVSDPNTRSVSWTKLVGALLDEITEKYRPNELIK